MKKLIVSRHPATVEWVKEVLPSFKDAVVAASVTPEDVRGAMVVGNLPLQLCLECAFVGAVEFTGTPPRGTEYGNKEMKEAGARIRWYKVSGGTERPRREVRVASGCECPVTGERIPWGNGFAVVVASWCPTDSTEASYVVELEV